MGRRGEEREEEREEKEADGEAKGGGVLDVVLGGEYVIILLRMKDLLTTISL